ncbi:MAG: metal ABC transporter permease [Pseudobacteriovorax sp.]|nr:metal ABC transporter permease [Pseudobacteriovorax sp.]
MEDLLILLNLYWISIVAATVSGVLLAQLGSQLAGRDQSLQVFCLSQGALTGVLLGLLSIMVLGGEEALHSSVEGHSLVPSTTALILTGLLSIILSRINQSMGESRNTIFVAIFICLMSLNSLISRLFPALEQQFSRVFFGNFTTVSIHTLEVLGLGTLLLGAAYMKRWKTYSRETFDYAFFGFIQDKTSRPKRLIFEFSILAYICICIQTLGFVGTLALLFLPTVLVRSWDISNIRMHLISVSLLVLCGVPTGFITSLIFPSLPTISVIVLMMAGLAGLVSLFRWQGAR